MRHRIDPNRPLKAACSHGFASTTEASMPRSITGPPARTVKLRHYTRAGDRDLRLEPGGQVQHEWWAVRSSLPSPGLGPPRGPYGDGDRRVVGDHREHRVPGPHG